MTAFAHLLTLTGPHGLYEHATLDVPRSDLGYCTDDNARLLVVTSREPDEGPAAVLSRVALAFTLQAQDSHGATHNRMGTDGRWTDSASTEDCWGRSMWAFGVAAAHHQDPSVRATAADAFFRGAIHRPSDSRTVAFAALGAAEVAASHPDAHAAVDLLAHAATVIGSPLSAAWVWPEARLRYANAALAEATLAAGVALQAADLIERGLAMTGWLLDRETRQEHLSVTGSSGSDSCTAGPEFDQQPIEVAALADACWRAYLLTGDDRWAVGVTMAADWYDGVNDVGAVMYDSTTGGSYDGLMPGGVNLNQGAESTLARAAIMQKARMLSSLVRLGS